MYDIILKHGKIMDGTGNPWYYGDLAICGDKIAAIGSNLEDPQARVLDVTGMVVAPGFVDTDMTQVLPENVKEAATAQIPLGRFGKPEDIANMVAYLASEKASYITGQIISVDGGMAI